MLFNCSLILLIWKMLKLNEYKVAQVRMHYTFSFNGQNHKKTWLKCELYHWHAAEFERTLTKFNFAFIWKNIQNKHLTMFMTKLTVFVIVHIFFFLFENSIIVHEEKWYIKQIYHGSSSHDFYRLINIYQHLKHTIWWLRKDRYLQIKTPTTVHKQAI